MDQQFEKTVAHRLRSLRAERGLTLDGLAELSGVSRAMISRVERGEASPTAALLARLCSALGVSLSVFFAAAGEEAAPLVRRADQPVWRDPESGYLRRVVSPGGTGSRVDVVEVEFPAGAEVRFPASSRAAASRSMSGCSRARWSFPSARRCTGLLPATASS